MYSQNFNIQFKPLIYLLVYGFHIVTLLLVALLGLSLSQKILLLILAAISMWQTFLQFANQKIITTIQFQKADQGWMINRSEPKKLLAYKTYHSSWLMCLCLENMKPILLNRSMLSAYDWAALRRTLHLYPIQKS